MIEADAGDGADWLTLAEAAAVAKVTRRTLYNWMAQHKVQVIYTAGGRRRILKSSLLRVLAPPSVSV